MTIAGLVVTSSQLQESFQRMVYSTQRIQAYYINDTLSSRYRKVMPNKASVIDVHFMESSYFTILEISRIIVFLMESGLVGIKCFILIEIEKYANM